MTTRPSLVEQLRRLTEGATRFADDMRAKNIHVGMGKVPRCVTCDQAWPCAASKEKRG